MPEIDTTDAALVAAHLAGDRGALATIYDRYATSLYDTAASMLSDRHEAADVMQDVFIVAAERLDQLRDPSRLRAWMFAILRNEVYRRTRRRRRSVPTDFTAPAADVAAADASDDADDAVEAAELGELVRAAARGLDQRDQLVLELSVRQGLEGSELADALGVSAQQGYNLVHRMRERTERSLTAYCVARAGRKDCDELAAILGRWDGEFTVLIRKRVARHIDGCETCDRSRRKLAPLALLRAAPAFAAPPDLRDRVLDGVRRGGGSSPTMRFRASDGFPRRRRRRRPPLWLAAAIAVVFVLTAGTTIVATTRQGAHRGDVVDASPTTTLAPAANPSITVAPIPAPTTTSTSTTSTTTNSTSTTAPSTTAPPTTAPPTTAPPTIVAAPVAPPTLPPAPAPPPEPGPPPAAPVVTPPSPPVTAAAPVTAAPPAPGTLSVSATSLDFDSDATSRNVIVTNGGGQPVTWGAAGAAPFQLSPATGTIAPGGSTTVTVTIDRAAFADGSALAAVASFTAAGLPAHDVSLTATVVRPPVITLVAAPPNPWCVSPSVNVATVSANITDEQPLSATLGWSGPGGQAGSVAMSSSPPAVHAGEFVFVGSDPGVIGTWSWQIVATDSLGHTASRSGSFVTQLC